MVILSHLQLAEVTDRYCFSVSWLTSVNVLMPLCVVAGRQYACTNSVEFYWCLNICDIAGESVIFNLDWIWF